MNMVTETISSRASDLTQEGFITVKEDPCVFKCETETFFYESFSITIASIY